MGVVIGRNKGKYMEYVGAGKDGFGLLLRNSFSIFFFIWESVVLVLVFHLPFPLFLRRSVATAQYLDVFIIPMLLFMLS